MGGCTLQRTSGSARPQRERGGGGGSKDTPLVRHIGLTHQILSALPTRSGRKFELLLFQGVGLGFWKGGRPVVEGAAGAGEGVLGPKKIVYQKWPKQICPSVNFIFPPRQKFW